MIRIAQIKLPLDHDDRDLRTQILSRLRISAADLLETQIVRRSIDARNKTDILLVYTVEVRVRKEKAIIRRHPRQVTEFQTEIPPEIPAGREKLKNRPVIVGAGPAGLFAGLLLARRGYSPLILERGQTVTERRVVVQRFWETGVLDQESNMQFGEGGAGTFSDGKLTTGIRDPRIRQVLEELVAAGAPPEILIDSRPHIGTDRLQGVVQNLRQSITQAGGDIRFNHRLTGLILRQGSLAALRVNENIEIPVSVSILAIGHSARDTYRMLHQGEIPLQAKALAIGVRIEHPQALIDQLQYGLQGGHPRLGAAEYKLTATLTNGRAVYSFCMCPGGLVVAAASENGGVVTNGMSFHGRHSPNANSALLVSVTPEDFPSSDPLAGIHFQRHWEEKAFQTGGGQFKAPVQMLQDFFSNRASTRLGSIQPSYRPGFQPADLSACLPPWVCDSLRQAFLLFERRMPGFMISDAVLTGVETRSSSPVRILRDPQGESSIRGLYPAGEGAGYAGGIMSSAVDGLRAAESIIRRFGPPL